MGLVRRYLETQQKIANIEQISIQYTLKDFPSESQYSNSDATLNVTYSDLLRAAYTVGRKSRDHVFYNGSLSDREKSFRINLIEAFIKVEEGKIRFSENFKLLDPTEKGGINYFISSTLSKLFAEKVFETPMLMHLDVYKRNLYKDGGIAVQTIEKNKRPDFVGLTSKGEWIVVESKGREKYETKPIASAKEQTKNLQSINGRDPILRLAVLTYIRRDEIQVDIADPIESNDDSFKLKIKIEDFIYDYYAHIIKKLKEKKSEKQIGNYVFYVNSILCDNYEIGMEKNLYKLLTESNHDFADEFLISLKRLNKLTVNDENISIGKDGVLFSIS